MAIFIKFLRIHRIVFISAVVLVCGGVFFMTYASTPPGDFPVNEIVTIKKDTYLSQVADILAEKNVIRSPFLYKIYTVLLGGSKKIMAGDYLFSEPQSVLRIAYRTIKGIQDIPKAKVTIPDGTTVEQIAAILSRNLKKFDSKTFVTLAKPKEGYLYPDTYFFPQNASPEAVIQVMSDTFEQNLKTVRLDIMAFKKSESDAVKMASLLEREANNSTDRKIIAGILWKRIEAGMPLQVDAALYYAYGRGSLELTKNDLASDSPYNLYKHTGLPPTPIASPSLEAIRDAVRPTATEYWFYLSDMKGVMHYAKTHDEHVANKAKYLP